MLTVTSLKFQDVGLYEVLDVKVVKEISKYAKIELPALHFKVILRRILTNA
jgi:hypothetical protein